ncbi:hypothetical protein VC83_04962 [Pseudogymnoascus destructans]|uniref:Uncharacterized protein n=1 Tax=Pseudogymnoascus destructans TaxID=655981 RepID=A0A177ABF3_9PEZI|nr:uncharacterized protein VC83_04962 [Pseudogymnoascus destructans]OAF58543.1 hypothetical protein VC83_04962 [Pseudogymnoascus destructans]
MDLRHEFGHVLMSRQTTNLQVCISTIVTIMEGPIADRAEKSSRANSALGGAAAEPITSTNDQNRPFEVGGDTLTDFKSAASRTCDNQKNACAKIANEGAIVTAWQ